MPLPLDWLDMSIADEVVLQARFQADRILDILAMNSPCMRIEQCFRELL